MSSILSYSLWLPINLTKTSCLSYSNLAISRYLLCVILNTILPFPTVSAFLKKAITSLGFLKLVFSIASYQNSSAGLASEFSSQNVRSVPRVKILIPTAKVRKFAGIAFPNREKLLTACSLTFTKKYPAAVLFGCRAGY